MTRTFKNINSRGQKRDVELVFNQASKFQLAKEISNLNFLIALYLLDVEHFISISKIKC